MTCYAYKITFPIDPNGNTRVRIRDMNTREKRDLFPALNLKQDKRSPESAQEAFSRYLQDHLHEEFLALAPAVKGFVIFTKLKEFKL